ncbi:hypothetical protein [Haloferax volcanii]|uniref:Restriction endonuclease type IV Mrr domain-containing protein n=1 Tax=Haloferax volcanii JCM 10717 TaxID=1227458 RepID=M0I7Q3_HALVO|nr:hypothetical protein [Haloferax alexandrinus]ELZ92821.1 hypothetical protein C452_05105 [Haloferax alexandrinus JCM 10717]
MSQSRTPRLDLPPVIEDALADEPPTEDPGRDVDGRGKGQGWWFETRGVEACRRWGYPEIAARQTIWGQEIDILAVDRRRHADDKPRYPQLLIECRDHEDGKVTPRVVWRTITLAQTAGCRPAVMHTHPLTRPAREICQRWGVVVIPLRDVLHADDVPQHAARYHRDYHDHPVSRKPNDDWPEILYKRRGPRREGPRYPRY